MNHGKEKPQEKGQIIRGGHPAMLYNTYFRRQSLAYTPEWVDEKFSGRLKLDVKAGEESED